nr:MAG TPA: hypothetical protein [Caudoviricetes sp.]
MNKTVNLFCVLEIISLFLYSNRRMAWGKG